MKKRLISLLAAGAAVTGTGLATATPAMAAPPYWQEVSTNSNWHCSPYKAHRLSLNIKFKTCIVRNASNGAQAVLVVQNSGTKAALIRGVLDTFNTGGDYQGNYMYSCKESKLNPGYTRGCFGTTFPGTNDISATSSLYMNGNDDINLSQDSWHG
ncbi:hypothetical protein [Streptomyces sp. NBC_00299]|uniref:hypothetical protein n=1 Tax=Streptomyces sp. NBC_00299 TaxID=2975705 RepID=UPI002E2BDB0D|nr:hypothetical protein [Streptomyces sp. NBC_00299]